MFNYYRMSFCPLKIRGMIRSILVRICSFAQWITHPASRAFICLLEWRGEKAALPESRQTFEVAAAQTSGLVILVFLSSQTVFFEWENPFFDKPMIITEPAVASTRLLGLGSKLYPSNMSSMLNKDLTRFLQRTPNRATERKALLTECG